MAHVSVRRCHRTNHPNDLPKTIFMPRESMAHWVVQLLWVDWLISAGLSYLQAAGGWPEMAWAGMIVSVTQDSDHPGWVFIVETEDRRVSRGLQGLRALPLPPPSMGQQESEVAWSQQAGEEAPFLDGKSYQVTLHRARVRRGVKDCG